jgi:hypothetical protein
MTAALKALFQRYIWQRAMEARREAAAEVEPSAG